MIYFLSELFLGISWIDLQIMQKQLFCKMKKTTNISPDKSRSIRQVNKIKFDLNPSNYKCFISYSQKPHNLTHPASPVHDHDQNETCDLRQKPYQPISELRIPYIRRITQTNSCTYSPQFNTQVLLMQYDSQQVYTDSIKPFTQKQPQPDTKSVNSQTSEENEIVKSCLKMLSEQTDTEPSSPPRFLSNSQSKYYQNISNYYGNYRCQNPEVNLFAIDLSRIEIDGRTTIMIRNIPNKYTQSLLLELFNKNHKKKIDFFYLPIDYKNNCNVGYAFLNFIHPKFIVDFYNEFHNKKWKLFNSEKICHICYARIQGTYQLSHHFDSSKRLREGQM